MRSRPSTSLRAGLSIALLAACSLHALQASAGTWDIKLNRLCQIETVAGSTIDGGGGYDFAIHRGVKNVLPDNAAFRSLMSELGVLFAPNILSPAETLGFNGFYFGAEIGFVTVNPKKNANDQRYWRAAESVSDTAFADEMLNTDRIERELPPSLASTVTIMARKGFWFPVPSFEMGIGIRHLIHSRMWAGVATAKVSIHEGFQGLPLPAVAVRGSGSRVFGTPGFNLTVAGLDFSMSKALGIASTFNLTPYVGYQLLWIVADSEVLDATPGRDAIGLSVAGAPDGQVPIACNETASGDCRGQFAFLDQSDILRHRFFIGIRANFYIASFLLEYSYFAGGHDAALVPVPGLPEQRIEDESGAQHSVSFSVALEY